MRIFLFAALLLAAACSSQAERCDFSHTREIAFTGGAAADRVTVRTFGVSCDKAIGVYEIIDGEGHPIWAWASPLPRAFGDVFNADDLYTGFNVFRYVEQILLIFFRNDDGFDSATMGC